MINEYASLSTRTGFNKSLGHFRLVSGILEQINQGTNLADLIDELEKSKKVEKQQIAPILNALVVDRMQYASLSFNLPANVQSFDPIRETTAKWNRLDLIVAYHHPQLGICAINPKVSAQWEGVQELSREELLVLYAKAVRPEDAALEADALEALRDLLTGHDARGLERFNDPALVARPKAVAAPAPAPAPAAPAQEAAPAAAPAARAEEAEPEQAAPAAPPPPPTAGGKRKVTPKYSIQVTNELFHNGNVEAWKNILASYKAKYAGLDVDVFHDGQKVNNINALFKWGKVKHGDVILFSVAGDEIKGVAKLQRYLFEGASIRFGQFLKKDVNKLLNLF
ncbi:MAG: hypothetical protein HY423_16425 [Candidatus Lambdaproteobacteria bacterium]|nr:hypothetical protein [Candidatus Lambdaproteobacteria bacterium]